MMVKEENLEVVVDGVAYVPKGSEAITPARSFKGKKYVIVRTYSAGVFAGYLDKRVGKEVTLLSARRLWYWDGAASLSQLSVDGVCNPATCKFPCEVAEVVLTEVIEVLPVTEKARLSIAGVKVWQQ